MIKKNHYIRTVHSQEKHYGYALIEKTTFHKFKIMKEEFPIVKVNNYWQVIGVDKFFNKLEDIVKDAILIIEQEQINRVGDV
mgnify:CR=1 FL=1